MAGLKIAIDPSHWQELYPMSSTGADLLGTGLYNSTEIPNFRTGSTFLHVPINGGASQQWQIFPLSSTTYALRSKESGTTGFLNTQLAADSKTTAVNMRNSTVDDKVMLWNIGNWPDGSLYFTNVANGTNLFLSVTDTGNTLMAPNTSSPAQSWQYRTGDAINDSAYSVVLGMPMNTASPTPSTSNAGPTSTSTSASVITSAPAQSSSAPTNHQGLSSGASAGIGVGVTAVALIAIASLAFFFLRKRKAKAANREKQLPPPPSYEPFMPKAEMASEPRPVEMGGDQQVRTPVAELMGQTAGHK